MDLKFTETSKGKPAALLNGQFFFSLNIREQKFENMAMYTKRLQGEIYHVIEYNKYTTRHDQPLSRQNKIPYP